jgi:hypothetical protein
MKRLKENRKDRIRKYEQKLKEIAKKKAVELSEIIDDDIYFTYCVIDKFLDIK